MKTPFDSSMLSGYLDGELDADEVALVERVLNEHPERMRELEALRHLQRSLATLPTPQTTVDPVAAVRTRIEQRRPAAAMETPRRWWLQITPFALAACLLLGVGWMMVGSKWEPAQLASEQDASSSSELATDGMEPLDETASPPEGEPSQLFSSEEGPRLARSMDQPTADFQRSKMVRTQPQDERYYQQPSSRDVQVQQRMIAPGEPASPSPRSRSLGRAAGNEEAELGGYGGVSASKPEADDAESARMNFAPSQAAGEERTLQLENRALTAPLALGAELSDSLQLKTEDAVRLQYEVRPEDYAATVRWLRTVVPRDLKELPSEGDVKDDGVGAEDVKAGDVKRYWFAGREQEMQDLQVAIKKRLEVTEGELKVVQSANAMAMGNAAGMGRAAIARDSAQRAASEGIVEQKEKSVEALQSRRERPADAKQSNTNAARVGGIRGPRRFSDSESPPSPVIIELIARPAE